MTYDQEVQPETTPKDLTYKVGNKIWWYGVFVLKSNQYLKHFNRVDWLTLRDLGAHGHFAVGSLKCNTLVSIRVRGCLWRQKLDVTGLSYQTTDSLIIGLLASFFLIKISSVFGYVCAFSLHTLFNATMNYLVALVWSWNISSWQVPSPWHRISHAVTMLC